MSIHTLSWVLRNSDEKGMARLVLIVLADHAKEDGSYAWPSVATIAQEAVCGRRTVQEALRGLEERGAIKSRGVSRSGTVIYDVNMGRGSRAGAESAPAQSTTQGGAATAPESSMNHQESERGVARARMRVGGKPVSEEAWGLALQVLRAFNAHAGRSYRPVKSSGQPSEAAKYIYKRIGEYPDLSFEKHLDIIRRVIASKWWGDAPPSFNVVYGPRVFEENITRPGVPRPASSGAEGERLARQARRAARMAELQAEEVA